MPVNLFFCELLSEYYEGAEIPSLPNRTNRTKLGEGSVSHAKNVKVNVKIHKQRNIFDLFKVFNGNEI